MTTPEEFEAKSWPLHDLLDPGHRRFILDALDCYEAVDGFATRNTDEDAEKSAKAEYVHDVIRWIITDTEAYDVSDRGVHPR